MYYRNNHGKFPYKKVQEPQKRTSVFLWNHTEEVLYQLGFSRETELVGCVCVCACVFIL